MCREDGKLIGWDVFASPEKGVWGLEQVSCTVIQGGVMRVMGISFPAALVHEEGVFHLFSMEVT